MKNQINQTMLKGLLALFVLSLSVGCASKKSDLQLAPEETIEDDLVVIDPNAPVYTAPATVPLYPDSNAAFTAYVGTHPLNAPQNLRVTVRAANHGTVDKNTGKTSCTAPNCTSVFGGQVFISYEDNGQTFTGRFETRNSTVTPDGTYTTNGHNGKKHAAYNRWFIKDGKKIFHGFYEDQYGAILILIDDSIDLGDGAGASELNGSIWFRNHQPFSGTVPDYTQIPCWFLERGPHDCRVFLTNEETLKTDSVIYPVNSVYAGGYYPSYNQNDKARAWRRLGTFTGLSAAQAGL